MNVETRCCTVQTCSSPLLRNSDKFIKIVLFGYYCKYSDGYDEQSKNRCSHMLFFFTKYYKIKINIFKLFSFFLRLNTNKCCLIFITYIKISIPFQYHISQQQYSFDLPLYLFLTPSPAKYFSYPNILVYY
jgi:hypothetical protein